MTVTQKVSVMNAFAIWFFTNAAGTTIMTMLVAIPHPMGSVSFIMTAGFIGALITLPVIALLYPMLYVMIRIETIAGRIVFIIFSMITISVLVGIMIMVLWAGGMDTGAMGGMIAIFSPWIFSAIGATIIIERKNVFRKQLRSTAE